MPKTRPLVSGCSGLGVSLSNLLSDALEAVADVKDDPWSTISSEDFLSRVHMCNELLKREKEKEEIVGGTDTEDIVVIGADVEALFPSLISEIVGRVIREAVIKSRIQLEDFNYKEMARYIRMGDKYRSNVGSLDRVLPVRRFVKGTTPGITGNEVLGNKDDE